MGKTKRVRAGRYLYHEQGRTFWLVEVRNSEGFPGPPLWHVGEVINGHDEPAFDSAETLADAKHWASIAANSKE